MKICFILETPFTHGGEQRVVSIISNHLYEQGYDVSIMCTDMTVIRDNSLYNLNENIKIDYLEGYNNKYVKKIRKRRERMNKANLEKGKYKDSLFIQKFINCDLITAYLLKRKIEKEKYDVVISLGIYNKILARVSKYVSAKTIGWQHSSSERYFEYEGEWFYNQDKYVKYMINNLDSYVVLTNKDREYIKNRFDENVIVINNPKSIISNKTTDLSNRYFIAVGRFIPVKNFLTLIEIYKNFYKQNKRWKLKIVGDGYLKNEYLKRIKQYGLTKQVEIVDYTNDISKEYLSSSIYLMSSLQEGWGMVMGEALEFGLPIISFDITSAPEMIVDGYNGYIVKKYDKKEYMNKMLELANDEDKLRKFSKRSKKLSKQKNDSLIIEKWISLFSSKEYAYGEDKMLEKSVKIAK